MIKELHQDRYYWFTTSNNNDPSKYQLLAFNEQWAIIKKQSKFSLFEKRVTTQDFKVHAVLISGLGVDNAPISKKRLVPRI